MWWGYSPLYITGKPGEDDFEIKTFVMHFVTPETKTTGHYWWSVYNEFEFPSPEIKQMGQHLFAAAFEEDAVAIKNMQHLLETDNTDYEEMIISGDKAGLLFRREVLAWVKEEYPDYA